MFEKVRDLSEGVYIIHPLDFTSFELMDFMVPSFVIAVSKDDYMVVFDPRSSTVAGFSEEVEISEDVLRIFGEFVGVDMKASKKDVGDVDPVESLSEDVEFYEELGVKPLERNGELLVNQRELKKTAEKFRIFKLIAESSRDFRYSFENPMISVSPGMAGLSLFTILDSRFMLWLRNQTEIEGEKFRFSMIRVFNVVIAKLTRRFHYEKMNILPYEIMIIPTRNEEKLKRFFDVVKLVNENIGEFLADNFPSWISQMNLNFERSDVLETLKSKEEFLDTIASIPDRRGVNLFKNRINALIDAFSSQLDILSRGVGEWMDVLLREVL